MLFYITGCRVLWRVASTRKRSLNGTDEKRTDMPGSGHDLSKPINRQSHVYRIQKSFYCPPGHVPYWYQIM